MDLFDLSGRVAIVTGGNGGIGLGMARGLARAGAAVAVVGRNREKSRDAASSLGERAFAVEADVTRDADVRAMVAEVADRAGRIDILVNNAGTNVRKRPEELAESEWHTVIDTNLTSAFLCSKACHPHMQAAGGGKILNNGSMMSLFGEPLDARLRGEQGRDRPAHQDPRHRLGGGRHPGQLLPARLDRHRSHPARARAGARAARPGPRPHPGRSLG